MKVEFEKVPRWLPWIIPFLTWRGSRNKRVIYLTFDDGPTLDVTSEVLAILDRQKVSATFFMLGEMVDKNQELTKDVVKKGHAVGNHGYAHLSGWRTGLFAYLDDVHKGRNSIGKVLLAPPRMFRPPYGQLGPIQGFFLWWKYRIVMFDVVAQDYREDLDPTTVEQIVLRHVQNGSIILLHDSQLSAPRTLKILESLICKLKLRGYEFGKLA